jgi:hypothetical protein
MGCFFIVDQTGFIAGSSSGMAHFSAAKRRVRGTVAQAVFRGEVFGRHSTPSVIEIWAMRDDGPPSGRWEASALVWAKIEYFGDLFTLVPHEHYGGFFPTRSRDLRARDDRL